jgi:hypothetical protein
MFYAGHSMRKKGATLILLLIVSSSRALFGQMVPVDPHGSPLPTGASAAEYGVVAVFENEAGLSRIQPRRNSGSVGVKDQRDVRLRDGMLIDTPRQYAGIFNTESEGIDWKTQRVYVVEELTVYKFKNIDSRTTLSGVYRSPNALYIGLTSTHLGPCQGIAQLPEWFSYHRRFVVLRIPRVPERIVTFSNAVGGCPPDIP